MKIPCLEKIGKPFGDFKSFYEQEHNGTNLGLLAVAFDDAMKEVKSALHLYHGEVLKDIVHGKKLMPTSSLTDKVIIKEDLDFNIKELSILRDFSKDLVHLRNLSSMRLGLEARCNYFLRAFDILEDSMDGLYTQPKIIGEVTKGYGRLLDNNL